MGVYLRDVADFANYMAIDKLCVAVQIYCFKLNISRSPVYLFMYILLHGKVQSLCIVLRLGVMIPLDGINVGEIFFRVGWFIRRDCTKHCSNIFYVYIQYKYKAFVQYTI